jgi:nitrogen fixation/metabolism regulation signal transduction histidine kinase
MACGKALAMKKCIIGQASGRLELNERPTGASGAFRLFLS